MSEGKGRAKIKEESTRIETGSSVYSTAFGYTAVHTTRELADTKW